MESALDVANIFRTEFHTNRAIRITKSSSIFSIIFEWFDRHRFVGSALALVINQLISLDDRLFGANLMR